MKNKKSFRCFLGFHKSGRFIYTIPHAMHDGYMEAHYKCNCCGDRYTKSEPMDARYPPRAGWEFYFIITMLLAVLAALVYYYETYA